jgi:hypothetical protein
MTRGKERNGKEERKISSLVFLTRDLEGEVGS